jgi:RND family efflux transporter MFP subunit
LLAPGQPVTLVTDAYPARRWDGRVERVAPVFREGSRQARVEVTVPNEDEALKPGMFARVETVLDRRENATIVPVEALTDRDGREVVFIVDAEQSIALMVPVRVGIRQGGRVEVIGDSIEGQVVTLGQQLLEEVSPITLPGARGAGGG